MANFLNLFPKAAPMRDLSRVYDLKVRLDWGEPALTIIDIRDRAAFNGRHVRGAIAMPTSELVNLAKVSLEYDRDIYIYGDTDEDAIAAASQLRIAGFQNVSVLRGGVAAWKAAGFPVEATSAIAA